MKKTSPFIVLCAATLLAYLPIILKPSLVLDRGNDLEEQFWPVFYFIKQQFILSHTLPLWNNIWMSGMPLLPDPQFSIFYPPHILFLILPTDFAFIVSILLHIFFAGVGMYLLGKFTFKLSEFSSLLVAIIYLSSPKISGFLEAGHPGLVQSWAFIPFVILSVMKLNIKPNINWAIVLGISLSGIFYTHTVIFVLCAIATIFIFFTKFFLERKNFAKTTLYVFISGIITFGLCAITLLPQIEWFPETSRFLLLEQKDVYPKWTSFGEFIQNIFLPWVDGIMKLQNIESEKWIPLGIIVPILSLIGFLKLKRKIKIFLAFSALAVFLISLNNISPINSLLLSQDWFALMRVATRVWFIPVIITALLVGKAIDALKTKRFLIIFVSALVLGESIFLSWSRLLKLTETQKALPGEIYELLTNDKDKFRVYCTNRCIPQKEAVINNLELVEGYNTIAQKNYYKEAWQLTGAYWDYYTLSIPPIGTYTFEKPQPDATALGEFNTKYVISPYELTDQKLNLANRVGEYFIYKNGAYLPRAYFQLDDQKPGQEAQIKEYSPNHIRVDASKHQSSRIVLSEVWSKGWNVYLNGKERISVQEKPNTLRLVDIKPDTQFIVFKYEPKSYKTGRIITFATILSIIFILLFKNKTKKYKLTNKVVII